MYILWEGSEMRIFYAASGVHTFILLSLSHTIGKLTTTFFFSSNNYFLMSRVLMGKHALVDILFIKSTLCELIKQMGFA